MAYRFMLAASCLVACASQASTAGSPGDAEQHYVVRTGDVLFVPGMRDVSAIGAGKASTIVLKRDGTLWIDLEPDGHVQSPFKNSGFSDVRAISAGYSHGTALRSDGSVLAWGDDVYHQLGRSSHSAPCYADGRTIASMQSIFPF